MTRRNNRTSRDSIMNSIFTTTDDLDTMINESAAREDSYNYLGPVRSYSQYHNNNRDRDSVSISVRSLQGNEISDLIMDLSEVSENHRTDTEARETIQPPARAGSRANYIAFSQTLGRSNTQSTFNQREVARSSEPRYPRKNSASSSAEKAIPQRNLFSEEPDLEEKSIASSGVMRNVLIGVGVFIAFLIIFAVYTQQVVIPNMLQNQIDAIDPNSRKCILFIYDNYKF
jgi:hypothetical protein